jgi:hypothetical protein
MANGPQRHTSWFQIVVSETLRAWVQTLVIVAGALFGIWQFYLKEVLWPATAPINLTTEVAIKEAGVGGSGSGGGELEAIELTIKARNPSSTRTVYLLTNYWRAWGVRITRRAESQDWLKDAVDKINKYEPVRIGTNYEAPQPTLVAAGNVFADTSANPDESLSRSFVFYIPKGLYDMLEVDVYLPTVADPAAGALYTLNDDGTSFDSFIYKTRSDGTRAEAAHDENGYTDPSIGLLPFVSYQQLSLWQNKIGASQEGSSILTQRSPALDPEAAAANQNEPPHDSKAGVIGGR